MPAFLALVLATLAAPSSGAADPAPVAAEPPSNPQPDPLRKRIARRKEFGPFFEGEPPSDTAHNSSLQRGKKPILSLGDGNFCFVDGSYCKSALLASAGVATGLRVPASNVGPDVPYSQFSVHAGLVVRPLMWTGRAWHPWGLGVMASWSRGTGSVTVQGDAMDQDIQSTARTDAFRVGVHNQVWLSKKAHGLHLDLTVGAVRSDVLTSGSALWGTHAEIGVSAGGWATLFAGGDFLDRDARIFLGMRAHGIAAAPLIALALAGMAIGGAL